MTVLDNIIKEVRIQKGTEFQNIIISDIKFKILL